MKIKHKQFIDKAIKGGLEEPYRCSDSFCNTDDAHLFLDPKAWQCAGYGRKEALELTNHIWDGGTIESYLKTL